MTDENDPVIGNSLATIIGNPEAAYQVMMEMDEEIEQLKDVVLRLRMQIQLANLALLDSDAA